MEGARDMEKGMSIIHCSFLQERGYELWKVVIIKVNFYELIYNSLLSMINVLSSLFLVYGSPDQRMWKDLSLGLFSFKSTYTFS